MSYRAPLKDMLFVHEANSPASTRSRSCPASRTRRSTPSQAVLEECAKFSERRARAAERRRRPRSRRSWQDGVVTTPPGFKEAFRQFAEGGWQGLQHPAEFGGQGLPKTDRRRRAARC